MFNKGKYVVGEIRGTIPTMNVFGAIVFPESISHDVVARLFNDIRTAGFFNVTIVDSKVIVEVHGGSSSLGVSSNESDVNHIERALGIAIK